MKKKVSIGIVFGVIVHLLLVSCAQQKYVANKPVSVELGNGLFLMYEEVEIKPNFVECNSNNIINKRDCYEKEMRKFINDNVVYPAKAIEDKIQGRVDITFSVDTLGNTKVEKVEGKDSLLIAAAEKAFAKLPKMVPAKHLGKLREVMCYYPVEFSLEGDENKVGSARIQSQPIKPSKE